MDKLVPKDIDVAPAAKLEITFEDGTEIDFGTEVKPVNATKAPIVTWPNDNKDAFIDELKEELEELGKQAKDGLGHLGQDLKDEIGHLGGELKGLWNKYKPTAGEKKDAADKKPAEPGAGDKITEVETVTVAVISPPTADPGIVAVVDVTADDKEAPPSLYTLYAFAAGPTVETCLWVVTNIPGDRVDKGVTVAPYAGPKPPTETTTPLNYVFLAFKQTEKVPEVAQIDAQSDRHATKMRDFVAKYKLGVPVAGNYVTALPDDYSKDFWAKVKAGGSEPAKPAAEPVAP